MDLFIFAIGFIGMIVYLVMLVINAAKRKPKKKPAMGLGICLVLMIIGLSMGGSDANSKNQSPVVDIEQESNDELDEKSKESAGESMEKETTDSEKEDDPGQDEVNQEIDYKIAQKDDISVGGAKRYAWEVVVNDKATKQDLEVLSKEIIEKAKEEMKFNAIVVGFYDYEEYIGHGYTLGKTTYAPDGDWAKAMEVKTGDYDKMDYTFELREKDWDKQLTEDEIEVYKAWKDLYAEKDTKEDLPDEDEVSKEVAEQFDMTAEEVDAILMKDVEWMFNDESK